MNLLPENNPALYAKAIVQAALEYTKLPEPPDEEFYRQRSACFVSIKKDGELRGCIGTLEPAEPDLGHEIMRNAQSAAFGDPRFPAVVAEEFARLRFSVDVLSVPEGVEGPESLDCSMYASSSVASIAVESCCRPWRVLRPWNISLISPVKRLESVPRKILPSSALLSAVLMRNGNQAICLAAAAALSSPPE